MAPADGRYPRSPGCARLVTGAGNISFRFFGGNRGAALERDRHACRACGSREFPNVHPRRRGDPARLVTLCAGCHVCLHRTRALRRWLPDTLISLWREWHPDAVEQLHLPLKGLVSLLADARWQTFSGFPARPPVAKRPLGQPDGGGKYFRVILPDPKQSRFDWPAGGLEGEGKGPGA